ncbi:MAG TPA: methionine biosynthesis protein MetW [Chitinophaga sp.]|uniref:methionine biosynthesis protein MetW n=1 Tax=Chitinophaga sp. TaxID=1869181 RepID=UPI002C35E71E|nr:methionine biosynthesis protein MetW [Chitinophaga sp.]HVI47138.1 methionine biosynthesis protein MetW [Chitinophaga sp.]
MAKNDNRNYNYEPGTAGKRKEFDVILSFADTGSSIVDLGCGDGTLLDLLVKERGCRAAGIELSPSGVAVCQGKGLDVRTGRIDEPLPFADDQFDISICSVSIQMVMYPEVLLREMKRISKKIIISFPNFAFYRNRLQLLLDGSMPKHMLFGYNWYDTGHIHQLSIRDFEQLVARTGGLRIVSCAGHLAGNPLKKFLVRRHPNLFQNLPVCLLEKSC